MNRLILLILSIICTKAVCQVIEIDKSSLLLADSTIFSSTSRIPCGQNCIPKADSIISVLVKRGYLEATYSERFKNGEEVISINPSRPYFINNIDVSMIPDELMVKERLFLQQGSPFLHDSLKALQNDVLQYYLNNGYPFAKVNLDSLSFIGNKISVRIKTDKGSLMTIKNIIDKNDYYNPAWLLRMANIERGEPFSDHKIAKLQRRLEIFGIYSRSPYSINSKNDEVVLVLDLSRPVPGTFDGLIGVQQDPSLGRVVATGFLDISLPNMFKSMKSLDINWRRIRKETQSLDVDFLLPTLFNGKMTMETTIGFFKQDSSFLNRNFHLILLNNTNSHFSAGLGYAFAGSSLLGDLGDHSDTTRLRSLDYHLNQANLLLKFTGENSLTTLNFQLGQKNIIKNKQVPNEIYELYSGKNYQLDINSVTNYSQRIKKKWLWVQQYVTGIKFSPQLFENELYRVGGIKSIRGFFDREYFAERFISIQSEFRFYSSDYTYFNIFADHGVIGYQNEIKHLTGFGVGLNVETGSRGTLQFQFALGKRPGRPIDPSQTVINLNYLVKMK